ncbi:MAG: hypothetical protein M3N32_05720 [Actinomycetota bacterium]|nr:hypothetical protein [Actinomycetota bacterium]
MLSVRAVAALVAVVALTACGRGEDRPTPIAADGGTLTGQDFPAPPFLRSAADGVVALEMREFRYKVAPSVITGPKVYLLVRNLGRLNHELELARADYPGYGSEKRVAELPPLEPDSQAELGVELTGGRYIIRCELPFGRTSHGQLGMVAELTVLEGPVP